MPTPRRDTNTILQNFYGQSYEIENNWWAARPRLRQYHLFHFMFIHIIRCKKAGCGALVRPHVVWFGESLDPDVLRRTQNELDKCDLCLVVFNIVLSRKKCLTFMSIYRYELQKFEIPAPFNAGRNFIRRLSCCDVCSSSSSSRCYC